MPACYALYRKGETERVSLQIVDNELRQALSTQEFVDTLPESVKPFALPEDLDRWFCDWHNSIGFLIATGHGNLGSSTLLKAVTEWNQPFLLPILAYLEEHFKSENWTEIGRR